MRALPPAARRGRRSPSFPAGVVVTRRGPRRDGLRCAVLGGGVIGDRRPPGRRSRRATATAGTITLYTSVTQGTVDAVVAGLQERAPGRQRRCLPGCDRRARRADRHGTA